LPQPPQLLTVRTFVSQPLFGSSSQSAVPGWHEAIWHVPVEQSPVPPVGRQTAPQAPQFSVVSSGDSQPLLGSSSQSARPASQLVIWQLPLEQSPAAPSGAQRFPQETQSVAVSRGVSQTLLGS